MLILRLSGYAVILGLVMVIIIIGQLSSADQLRLLVFSPLAPTLGTSEYSPVEWLQVGMLTLIAGLAWRCTRVLGQYRVLGYLMLSVAVAAIVRELDLFLDYYLLDQVWQLLVALLGVGTIVYCYRHFKALRVGYARVMPSVGMALMICGITTLLIFANLFGHEPFWQSLMGDGYRRIVKLAAEELVELLGYWLWLIGQLEFTFECRAQRRLSGAAGNERRERRRERRE